MINGVKELAGQPPPDGVVRASWMRSHQAGLDPTKPMDPPTSSTVNRDGRLFRAATPVLQRMRSEISGERLSVMLVNSQAEMFATVNGCAQIDAVVERIGATPGAVWREDTTGTNALATPFETRQPLFVRGRQHYVDRLKDYSCYGSPIVNPVNGRLVGVLDIMSDAGAESALMRPFIDRAVTEIEDNIRQSIGYRTMAVIRAFEAAARHPASMVVAISRSMVLQSSAAAGVLSSADIGQLRRLTENLRTSTRAEIELANGHAARLELEIVDGSDGVLVRVQSRQRPVVPRTARPLEPRGHVDQWISGFRQGTGSGVVVGESGSGRTTVVNEAAAGQTTCRIRAHEGADAAVQLLAELRQPCHDVLVIDDLDRLSVGARDVVERILVDGSDRILASTTIPEPDDEAGARLLDRFTTKVELPALRNQRRELLSTLMLVAGPGVQFRFTPQAQHVLESYSWPGNHRELASVIRSVERLRGTLIDVADLPAALRIKSTTKAMTPWQQASCDAIIRALDIFHGNKAHAADYLGISRSTLYHHIKEYGIVV